MADMPESGVTPQPLKKVAIKGVATLSFQNLLLQIIWFFTSLALLNSISVTDFSVLKLVFAAVAVPSALYISGLDPIILADLGVEREFGRLGVLKGLFRSYVLFELVSAVVIWSGFMLALTFARSAFSPPTQQYLFVASFLIFSRPLQNIFIQFNNLYFQFGRVTLIKLYDECTTLIATLIFVWYLKQGLHAAIMIQVISPFISILFATPAFISLYRKKLGGVQQEHGSFFARLKAHGKWSVGAAYLLKAQDALRLFLIDHFIGRSAVALFSLADSLWGYMSSLFPIKSILDAMLPQRAKDETAARQNLVRGTKYALMGFTVLGICASIGGYPFLFLFFPKYIAAFPIFLGLLLVIPRFSFTSALSPLLRAYKFQRPTFTTAVWSLFLTVVLALGLYPIFGVAGVVAEVVITNTVAAYLVYHAFWKTYPFFRVHLPEFFTWDAYDADTLGFLRKKLRLDRSARVS